MVHQVVHRRMGEDDGGIHFAHDADGAAAISVVVFHFQVFAAREVKPRADDVRGGLGFLESQRPNLGPRQGCGADIAAGHDGDVNFAAALREQRQRAGANKFHVVGVTAEGQNSMRLVHSALLKVVHRAPQARCRRQCGHVFEGEDASVTGFGDFREQDRVVGLPQP